MNPWQTLKQLRYKILSLSWGDGADEAVVAGCIVTAGAPEMIMGILRNGPLVMLKGGTPEPDPAHAGILTFEVLLTIVTSASMDKSGTAELIGGGRDSTSYGQGSSVGRGIYEIEEVILAGIRQGAGEIGMGIQVAYAGGDRAGFVGSIPATAIERRLRCRCTTDRYYHPPQRLQATGGGSVSLSWALPPDRFDRYKIVLRRASGATPPASATAGTGVTLASDLATSVTDSPGAGTYSYAIFCAYDESKHPGDTLSEAQRYSAQEVGTTRASVGVA